MQTSYAVTWREGDGPMRAGKLELLPKELRLEGGPADGETWVREIAYRDLRSVHVGRSPAERIDGRPSLILELRRDSPIRIASVIQHGIVSELTERLTSLVVGEWER